MSNVQTTSTTSTKAAANNTAAKATVVATTVATAKAAIARPVNVKQGSIKYRLLSEIASASAAVKAICKDSAMFDELDELATAVATVARLNGREHNDLPLLGLYLVNSGQLTEGKYTKYLSLFGAPALNGANLVDRFQAAIKRTNKMLQSSLERKLQSDDKEAAKVAAEDLKALADLKSDFKAALEAWEAAQK